MHATHRVLVASLLGAFALVATYGAAHALPQRPMLTVDVAEQMAVACAKFAEEQGFNPLNIAVVDEQGNLIYFRRKRDSYRGSAEIAINKAWTAAKFPFSTRFIGEKIVNRDPNKVHGIQFMDRVTIFPGGLPVMAGDYHIGAIGVSGESAANDEKCAQAGLDAVQDMLQ